MGLFSRLDAQISLAFLQRYPTPEKAARLGRGRMAAFLSREGYRGRKSAEELVARLRNPRGLRGEEAQARGAVVVQAVEVIETLNQGISPPGAGGAGSPRRASGTEPHELSWPPSEETGLRSSSLPSGWGAAGTRPAEERPSLPVHAGS